MDDFDPPEMTDVPNADERWPLLLRPFSALSPPKQLQVNKPFS
jgi:hypothetical protein